MVIIMANKANSLAHTKWMCKYHIIFTPEYRRKVIYNQYRKDLGEILRELCGSLTLAHSQNSQMSFMYGFFFVKFLIFTVVCVVIMI